MVRTVLYGLAALFAVDVILILARRFRRSSRNRIPRPLWRPVPRFRMTAYVAPRHRMALGTSMALPSAALIIVLPALYGAFGGRVDSFGLLGGAVILPWFLLYNFSICAFGVALGNWLAVRRPGKGGVRLKKVKPARAS